jgi:hypothetical protein
MVNPSSLPIRRTLLKSVGIAVIAYLLVTAGVASVTPVFRDRNPAFAIWLGGGLILFVIVARFVSRSLQTLSWWRRVIGAVVVAMGVSVVSAFIGFVLLVNIWERLGLGH